MEATGKKRPRKTKLVCRQVVELDEELQKLINATQDLTSHESDEVYNVVTLTDPNRTEVNSEVSPIVNSEVETEVKTKVKKNVKPKVKTEVKIEVKNEVENEVITENLLQQQKITTYQDERPPDFDAEEPPEFDEEELEKDKEWKLVFEEPDIEEHEPYETPPELSVASKLIKLKENDCEEADDHLQFSVNIEVEQFESEERLDFDNYDNELDHVDDDFCIETSNLREISLNKDVFENPYAFHDHDYEKSLDLLSRDDINQIIHEEVDANGMNSDGGGSLSSQKQSDLIDKETVLNKMEKLKECKGGLKYLSPQFVLQTTKEALWKDIQDMKVYVGPVHKVIQLNMINNFGKLFDIALETSELEETLNTALDTWNSWYRITLEPIYCYKCYICRKAWYYLYEFRLHLKNHKEHLLIDVEVFNLTCNIVAFEGELPKMEMIPISNKCIICVKSSEDHEIYSCFGCSYIFQSCSRLREHEGRCHSFRIVFKQKYGEDAQYIHCKLCKLFYFSRNEFDEHLVVKHLPRTDYVMPYSNIKQCMDCNMKRVCRKTHVCATKPLNFLCVYCDDKFNSRIMLKLHEQLNKVPVKCNFCGEVLHRRCREANHMMQHTNKYVAVHRCVLCVNDLFFFKNLPGLKLHKLLFHAGHKRKTSQYGQRMIIPAKCFDVANESIQLKIDQESKALEEQLQRCNDITDTIPNPSSPLLEEYIQKIQEIANACSKTKNEKKKLRQKKKAVSKTKPVKTKKHAKRVKKPVNVAKKPLNVAKNNKTDPNIWINMEKELYRDETSTSNGDNNENYEVLVTNMSEPSSVSGLQEAAMEVLSSGEIKEEPMDYDDGMASGSIYNMSFFTGQTTDPEAKYEDIEPETILHSFLKLNYKCTKCGYLGGRKEYKEHMAGECKTKPQVDPLVPGNWKKNAVFRCTKCTNENTSLKGYIKHLRDHGLEKHECPECRISLKCNTTLTNHILVHIKDLFQRIVTLSDEQIRQNYCYRCKVCKLELVDRDFFEHWESHLALQVIKQEYDPVLDYSEQTLSKLLLEASVSSIYEGLLETWPVNMGSNPVPNEEFDQHEFGVANPMLQHIPVESMQAAIKYLIQKKAVMRMQNVCVLCDRKFNRSLDTKRHIIEHLLLQAFANKPANRGLKCQICGAISQRPDKYKHHMREHARLPIYTCQLCNRSFSDSSNFAKHKKVHNYKVLICDLCGRKFHSKVCIEKHMESHLKQNQLYCKECKGQFSQKSDLTRHVRRVHLKKKTMFKCQICRKVFLNTRTRLDHMWHVHKERSIKADCPVCGEMFRKITEVNEHVKSKHPGQMLGACQSDEATSRWMTVEG